MITFALAMLFATAAVLTARVLASSFRDAFAAFGELRRAAAACEDLRVFVLRYSEVERRPAAMGLRPASRRGSIVSAMRRPQRRSALRAAA